MKDDFQKYAVKHLNFPSTTVEAVANHQVNASVGTPMILEEREMRATQMSVFDRLMLDRIITINGVVDERMSSIIQAQLLFLDSQEVKDITMHISTPGGGVISGLGIVDLMNYIKSDVKTVNLGLCASMGSVLLSSGTKGKRTSLISARTMLHHVSSGTQGVIDDQRVSLMESEKYNYLLFKILAENTNNSFKKIHDDSNRDKWFNSDEALKYGLIDEIVGINENNSINNLMDGFSDYYNEYVLNK